MTERLQPSTLHKLRQLGRCTNTDTPDTAYQLDAEADPAEVANTKSNTQPSCSGVGESDCVLQGGHGRLTPSYIVTLTDAPTIFKVGLEGLTAQSTMEAELVAVALAMKDEALFCSNNTQYYIYCVCVCVCVFIKLHITTQSGPVILVILCHSH